MIVKASPFHSSDALDLAFDRSMPRFANSTIKSSRRTRRGKRSVSLARCSRHSQSWRTVSSCRGFKPEDPLTRRQFSRVSASITFCWKITDSSSNQSSRSSFSTIEFSLSMHFQQVGDVVQCIGDLVTCQRSTRPIRPRLALGKRFIDQSLDQACPARRDIPSRRNRQPVECQTDRQSACP